MKSNLISIFILIILISSISSAQINKYKTCNELINGVGGALEKNFPNTLSKSKLIENLKKSDVITRQSQILKNVEIMKDPSKAVNEIIPDFYYYFSNKDFTNAEKFLDESIESIRKGKMSNTDKEFTIKYLNSLKNRNFEAQGLYIIESFGDEWGKVKVLMDKSTFHVVNPSMGEVGFVQKVGLTPRNVGVIQMERILSDNLFKLKGSGFVFSDGRKIVPLLGDLESLEKDINKLKPGIAKFSRDASDLKVEYITIGKTKFSRRFGKPIECIENC